MSSNFKDPISKSTFFNEADFVPRPISSRITRHTLLITLFTLLSICGSLVTVNAQRRDNLTNEEDLQIREVQELDARMKVLVHVISRRLLALSTPTATKSKEIKKETDKWGELRMGTTLELFYDIQRTLDEAIAKIDDVAEREQKNPLFSKAVHVLSEGCQNFTPQFKSFVDKATDPKERALIVNSIETCSQIIEASTRVPKEEKQEKKKKN